MPAGKLLATTVVAAKSTTMPMASGVSVHEALLVSAVREQDSGATLVSRFSLIHFSPCVLYAGILVFIYVFFFFLLVVTCSAVSLCYLT